MPDLGHAVARGEVMGQCYEWQGARNKAGYGRTTDGRLVHRVVFEAIYGILPKELEVCHACDNPPCYNLAHLWAGTSLENAQDMVAKGRGRRKPFARGVQHPNAQLDVAAVLEIRRTYDERTSYAELGRMYGVAGSTIASIVQRKTWRHV